MSPRRTEARLGRLGGAAVSFHTGAVAYALRTFVLLALLASGLTARADQTDARLDVLFARLHETKDLAEGSRLTNRIWAIWHESSEESLDRVLAIGTEAMGEGMRAAASGFTGISKRRYEEALARFNELIAQAPDFAEAWNKRATLYYVMHEYDASARDVERTLALEPRHFGALSGLGLINLAIGDDEAALHAFEAALEANPHLVGTQQRIQEIRARLTGKAI